MFSHLICPYAGSDVFNERWQHSDSWNVYDEGNRVRFALVTLILSFFAS